MRTATTCGPAAPLDRLPRTAVKIAVFAGVPVTTDEAAEMPFKVQIGNLTIEVDTEAELDVVVKRYAGSTPNGTRENAKIPSASQREAIRKLIYSIDNVSHQKSLRLLARKGGEATDTELRELTKDGKRISGFSGGLVRRCPAFGLDPKEVLTVDKLGYAAGKRAYRYRLGTEVLQVLKELGWDRESGTT